MIRVNILIISQAGLSKTLPSHGRSLLLALIGPCCVSLLAEAEHLAHVIEDDAQHGLDHPDQRGVRRSIVYPVHSRRPVHFGGEGPASSMAAHSSQYCKHTASKIHPWISNHFWCLRQPRREKLLYRFPTKSIALYWKCCTSIDMQCHLLKQALLSMPCTRIKPKRCSEGMHLLIAHARRAAAAKDERLLRRVLGCHLNAVQIHLHIQSICRRCRAALGAACRPYASQPYARYSETAAVQYTQQPAPRQVHRMQSCLVWLKCHAPSNTCPLSTQPRYWPAPW